MLLLTAVMFAGCGGGDGDDDGGGTADRPVTTVAQRAAEKQKAANGKVIDATCAAALVAYSQDSDPDVASLPQATESTRRVIKFLPKSAADTHPRFVAVVGQLLVNQQESLDVADEDLFSEENMKLVEDFQRISERVRFATIVDELPSCTQLFVTTTTSE